MVNELPSTSSMGFAAYLRLRKYEICSTEVGIHKYKFTFNMTRDMMDKEYKAYQVSEFFPYDSILQSLRREVRGQKYASSSDIQR